MTKQKHGTPAIRSPTRGAPLILRAESRWRMNRCTAGQVGKGAGRRTDGEMDTWSHAVLLNLSPAKASLKRRANLYVGVSLGI